MSDRLPFLQPGHNAWREVTARSSGLLVDASDYYHAVYWAARGARRSILMSGWEFDRTVELVRGPDAPAGAEVRFLNFLNGLCEQNPDLYVCVLAWDFHMVLAAEREWLQEAFFHWMTHPHLHFRMDPAAVSGGSQHQKFIVIDGRVAFLGGMDVCEGRWDDRRHLAEHPHRLGLAGAQQKPYHDVQVYLAGGDAPTALEQYFFQRWQRAGGTLPPLPPALRHDGVYEPRGAVPLGATTLALSRTEPHAEYAGVREVERLFVDAIASAERLIFIETQYFSSRRIADALVHRMRAGERERLEIVVLVNERAEAFKEEVAVGLRQVEIIEHLRTVAAETGHALGCYYTRPAGGGDEPGRTTYVHSKVMAVDDRFLTVGSANLTNRSMGVDSELHASWDTGGTDARLARVIRRARVSLIAEHTGVSGVRRVRGLVPIAGLVARLDAIAAEPGARLRSHRRPTPTQQALLATVDPQSLPFDPETTASLDREALTEPSDERRAA